MSRPLMLDGCSGEGGAAKGYRDAGFDVVCVDIKPQPRCPFLFVQDDIVAFLRRNGRHFDAIHVSPPCQAHTTMSNRWRGTGSKADSHADLIAPVRDVLYELADRYGIVWVIENVPGARKKLRQPVTYTGGAFGLRVHRPRLFESNAALIPPPVVPVVDPIGVYGKAPDGRRLFTRKDGSVQRAARSIEEASDAMGGMPWMSWRGIAESIPPAYTRHIGAQLMSRLISQHDAKALGFYMDGAA